MDEPVDISNFRARAHAIVAKKRKAEPFMKGGMEPEPRLAPAQLTNGDNLMEERTDWAWRDCIAIKELHLIAGDPEAGKTSCALSHAAVISAGARWPDGTPAKVRNVIIWTGKDSPERTIVPRLLQMGADRKKLWFVTGQPDENGKIRPFNPATDLPGLALAAKALPDGVGYTLIDPLVSVIGGKVDNGNNAAHREKLQPLVDFAKEFNCAVVGITHFTKGTIGKDPVSRVTGSLAFGALARIVMVATKNKQGEPERMLLMAKNNLTDKRLHFGYSIIGSPLYENPEIIASRVVWGEQIEGTARELLAQAEDDGDGNAGDGGRHTGPQDALRFLASALARGERPQTEIAAEAEIIGISKNQLHRASSKLDIAKRPAGMQGQWLWKLR
jgi:putative DNA primase/helicase